MAELDETDIRTIAYQIVVYWIARHVGVPPDQVDVGRTLMGDWPSGYGMSEGAYMKMCDEVTAAANRACGRAMVLDFPWRRAQEDDTVGAFIAALAVRLLASPITSIAAAAAQWSREYVVPALSCAEVDRLACGARLSRYSQAQRALGK